MSRIALGCTDSLGFVASLIAEEAGCNDVAASIAPTLRDRYEVLCCALEPASLVERDAAALRELYRVSTPHR